jgi:branched-chain amino acid transport system ATP-binding protein/branched-chain amino acid transport system permease protein
MRYLNAVGFLFFGLVLILVPLQAANEYELRLFMLFLIYSLIAAGLNVLVGLSGLVSLGQAGFFALGSYTAAILATRLHFDIVACCISAAVVCVCSVPCSPIPRCVCAASILRW